MTDEVSSESSEPVAGRRAADAVALKFREAELRSFTLLGTSFDEGDVEIIDMDGALPCGSEDDFHQAVSSSVPVRPALTPEQKKQRLQLAAFKHSFDTFEVTKNLSWVNIADLKRGDIVVIKTVVGKIFLRVVDRIKGELAGTGEILCECHYDLSDQYSLAHVASIQLPICTNSHVIVNPDGSTRLASRKLKMSTDAVLPIHVSNIFHERFFVEIEIYANPRSEKFRLVDFGRWITRIFLKLKALVDKNNRSKR